MAAEEQVIQEEICTHWVTVTAHGDESEVESVQNKGKDIFLYSENNLMENIEKGMTINRHVQKRYQRKY